MLQEMHKQNSSPVPVRPGPEVTAGQSFAGEIYIAPASISTKDGKTRISARIRVGNEDKTLWFEVDAAYGQCFADDTLDGFVAASLIPAILRGENIRTGGVMSSRLYYNLTNYLIPILSDYLQVPRLTHIIPAGGLGTAYVRRGTGVAAGFSGGIDSFCNYYDHSGDRAPAEFQLTHLIFNNVGSHGQKEAESDRALFRKRYLRLMSCAALLEKPAISVDSNLDAFIGQTFQLTHTLRNTAVALLMQHEICKFQYSSGYPLAETKLGPDYNMSRLDPVIMPLLSTERLECTAAGGQHTRVEKTRRVAEIPASRVYLDVCVTPQNAPEGYSNCAICWKCIRTATTLKVFGKLEEYHKVFHRGNFNTFENLYLIEVMGGKSPFAGEIRDLIHERKHKIPRSVRIIAKLLPAPIAQQMSIRIIPALIPHRRFAKFVNWCLSW